MIVIVVVGGDVGGGPQMVLVMWAIPIAHGNEGNTIVKREIEVQKSCLKIDNYQVSNVCKL